MPSSTLSQARAVLQKHWGYEDFRKAQSEILPEILAGQDVLCILPTSAGKSVLFQVPAILDEGCTIVVSPLIALMKDQVDDCVRRGIPASFVNSHVDQAEAERRFAAWVNGEYKLFYIAPERIRVPSFRRSLARAHVARIAVDECHCHPPETPITMADGIQRRIDEVAVGDRVLAQGTDGRLHARRVERHRVIPIGTRKLLRISTEHGSVTLTDDHKLYVEGRGEIEAGQVRAGDTVVRLVREGVVRAADSGGRSLLRQSVLGSGAARANARETRGGVRALRRGVRPREQRRGADDSVLLSPLCVCQQGEACGTGAVRGMREAVRTLDIQAHTQEAVLLRSLPLPLARTAECGAAVGDEAEARDEEESCAGSSGRDQVTATAQAALSGGRDRVSRTRSSERPCGLLPPGSRVSSDQSGGGVRRCNTLRESQAAGAGSTTGLQTQTTRVDRIEVLERGDTLGDRSSGFDHRLVHSLTVEVDHNYFAGEIRAVNCAAQWGHDFRPAYMRIHEIVDAVEKSQGARPPILAVTATATWEIEGSISRALGMKGSYVRYVADPMRPNLSYEVLYGSPYHRMRDVVEDFDPDKGRYVVYTTTRKAAEEIAEMVTKSIGCGVGVYHAGFSQGPREQVQNDFKSGRLPVVVATSAFGMGIDVPDIRMIVHFGIPDSLESYIQQTGRAGRDGLPSRCVLLSDDHSVELQHFFLDGMNPPYGAFEALWRWLNEAVADETDTLRLSADAIAGKMTERGKRWNGMQIGTALNTLESEGLLVREYAAESTPISVDLDRLMKVRAGMSKEVKKRCCDALAEARRSSGETSFYVSKQVLARAADTNTVILNAVLKELEAAEAIELGTTFMGKTTRVKKFRAELSEHLAAEVIENKRQRALARLNRMIAYSSLPNPKQRAQLVRGYFLGTEAE